MEPSQRRLLQLVYDHLVRTGKWPPTRYVRVEMRDHGRLEDICREVGKRLIVCGTNECSLRLAALPHVVGAEVDIQNRLLAVNYFVRRYIEAEGRPDASFAVRMGPAELDLMVAARAPDLPVIPVFVLFKIAGILDLPLIRLRVVEAVAALDLEALD